MPISNLLKKYYARFSKKIRTLTITKRLIAIFILITIIPILSICLYSSVSYQKSVYAKMEESTYQTLLAHNVAISSETSQQKKYSYNFLMNDDIQSILETEAEQSTIDMGYAILNNMLTEYIWSSACENILVSDLNYKVRGTTGIEELQDEFFEKTTKHLELIGKNECWSGAKTLKGTPTLVFSKKIYSKKELGKLLGYLHMVYNEKKMFANIFQNFNLADSSNLFILDEEYRYLSVQKDKEKLGQSILNEGIKQDQLQQKSFITNYNGQKTLFVVDKNLSTDWYLVAAISCDYINQDISKTLFVLCVIALLIIAISMIPIIMVSSTIIAPMNRLSSFMNQVAEGNYVHTPFEVIHDEVGDLTKNCEYTVERMILVMKENEQKGIRQRQLELQRLQAQINPHFLFNTLNSFKYVAMLNNLTTLTDGITSFCNLLRQTIIPIDEMIMLEQEFVNVKNYCDVQQIKYAGQFELKQMIQDEVKDVKVPRLILQPLVENCLVHGMKEDILLHINVMAYMKEEEIVMIVSDDGKGIKDKKKTEESKLSCFTGIGMNNVKERLELIYGRKMIFEIHSKLLEGTEIEIRIRKEIECTKY